MEDGIVDWIVYFEIFFCVEYYMMELGMLFLLIVEMMYDWGKMWME